jgi:alkaline phosphatase D
MPIFSNYLMHLLILVLCFQVQTLIADSPLRSPTVILISLDGIRHDFPDRTDLPGFLRMEIQGVRAAKLIPVYPSNTFPGHVSIATGAKPGVHGILDNVFFDRLQGVYRYSADANWMEAEPLWVTSERQGIRSAVYFWVGSETAWHGQSASYRMAPFDVDAGEAVKVAQIVAWLDLPEQERPGLIMSYWAGTDGAAHRIGPDHPDINEKLQEQDHYLGTLQQALDERKAWGSTTLILVSDHGMTRLTESIDVESMLKARGMEVKIFGGSSLLHIFLGDDQLPEPVLHTLATVPQLNVYLKSALPDNLQPVHTERTGDIIVTVEPPYSLRSLSFTRAAAHKLMSHLQGWHMGGHGYDANHADMGGIFFAMGRGIPEGVKLHDVHQLDVAATVSDLLQMDPPLKSEGNSIMPALR